MKSLINHENYGFAILIDHNVDMIYVSSRQQSAGGFRQDKAGTALLYFDYHVALQSRIQVAEIKSSGGVKIR
ncbi:hypothetical protein RvY_05184 [Ramazzottius varieornatus]|uniref:Uncharacterized protein n=1 Tax=Ramazzottius varieornatus TaxID=947166 RepID=A0A1D1UUT2_RAMVA|nr:hypothetical protein RvY_05184 [Ramazzottius varieornatus]